LQNSETQLRLAIDLAAGRTADGDLGVALILNPAATVNLAGEETKPGVVFLPWQARLLAYALLHQAEAIEHGLISSAKP
jgi:hypothetical protein